MAATVEGVFRILDRATGPMRRMEQQAKATDRAINDLGRNMDSVADRSHAQAMDRFTQSERTANRETQVLNRNMDRTQRVMAGTRRETQGLGDSVIRLGAVFGGLGRIMRPAMFIAILSVIRPLIATVGALGGGVVALAGQLGQMAGAAGAIPATYGAIGLAMGTAKLAMADVTQALSGNRQALRRLTPEARSFVRTLNQYKPVLQDIRREAQRGLFPGLEFSIRRLQRGVPLVTQLVGRMARAMGREAGRTSVFLTTPAMLRDLGAIGNQSIRIFGRMAQGGRNLLAALVDITAAARPFTGWLTRTILGWTRGFREFIQQQRGSGGLDRFFDRTRRTLTRVFSITSNLWRVFVGIGRAARPLGEWLLRSFDRATARWAAFFDTRGGRNTVRAWFNSLRPVLQQLGGLLGDVGGALFRLSDPQAQGQAARMIGQMRQWVPVLERILHRFADLFGDNVATGIGQLIRLVDNLTGPAGSPLQQFLTTAVQIVKWVNDAIERFPVLGRVIQAAFTLFATRALVSRISSVAFGVQTLARRWLGVKAAADLAAAAEGRALALGGVPVGGVPLGVPGGARPGAPGGPVGGPFVLGGPRGPSPRGVPPVGGRTPSGIFLPVPAGGTPPAAKPGLLSRIGKFIGFGGAAGGGAEAGVAATGARAALGSAARFIVPAAAVSAVFGALRPADNLGQRAQNAASGFSFGLIPGAQTAAEKAEANRTAREQGLARAQTLATDIQVRNPLLGTRTGIRGGERDLRDFGRIRRRLRSAREALEPPPERLHRISGPGGTRTERLPGETREEGLARVAQAHQVERLLRQLNTAAGAAEKRLQRTRGREAAEGWGRAFQVYSKSRGPEFAMDRVKAGILARMGTLKQAGRRELVEGTLAWARELERANPKMKGFADRLEAAIVQKFKDMHRRVVIVNGDIRRGTATEWRNIAAAMIDPAERARQEVNTKFTLIQQKAVGTLVAMGFRPNQARQIVRAGERGGPQGQQKLVNAFSQENQLAQTRAVPSRPGALTGDAWGYGGRRMPGTGEGPGGGARGGAVGGVASLKGANAGMAPYAQDAASYGLGVSSGLRPGAITATGNVSYHASGHALDLTGSPSQMLAFARHAASSYGSALEELIHTPLGFSIKNGQRVAPYAQADHYDHVHLADAQAAGALGAGGVAGLQIGPLQVGASAIPGAPGAMVDQATGLYGAALRQRVNAVLAGGGFAPTGGALGMTGFGTAAGGTFDKASLAALWSTANPGSRADPNLMAAIALAESSGNPGARNPSGASGLWQILGLPFAGDPFDPMTNARMAEAKYESQGLGAWVQYTSGAYKRFMDGWGHDGASYDWGGLFGDGGIITAARPTLIGIGERGEKETAVVTKGDGPGRAGGVMHVTINVHAAKQDTRKEIEAALMAVARDLDMTLMEDAS